MKRISYIFILTTIIFTHLSLNNVSQAVQLDNSDTRIDLPVITTPNNAITPQITADERGHVYVAWSDNRGGPYKVYVNTKFAEGGWAPRAVPINTGFPKAEGATTDGDASLPKICSDGSGHVYVVWVDDRAVKSGTGKKDIYFRYSKDYGLSWQAPDPYTDYRVDSDNPAPGNSINPQIACDGDGNVYIVWNDDRNKAGIYEVYFRSLKIQFSSPTDFISPYQTPELRLNTGVTAGVHSTQHPVISTDKKGAVYVAWMDERVIPEEKAYPGIYFNVSRNHGTTWNSSSTRIDTAPIGSNKFRSLVISSDNSGRVYAAWLDNGGRAERGEIYASDATYDVYFNASYDYGVTWTKTDQRIDTPVPGDQIEARHVTIANNNKGIVCIAWSDNTFGEEVSGVKTNYNIFFSHSENFGQSFIDAETNQRIDMGIPAGLTNAANPVIKVSEEGNVFAVWVDKRGDKYDVFFNFSQDRGKRGSWRDYDYWLDNISPYGSSYSPVMAIDNVGNVYMAWEDDRSTLTKDNYNIYFISGFLDPENLIEGGQRLGEACFIATAAYGSAYEGHVVLLRKFRDKFLLTNKFGSLFVHTYYKLSPPAAQFISGHPFLKSVVRVALLPVVGFAALTLKTTLLQKLLLALFMTIALFISWRKLRTRI